jgi:hypothetical protein
MPRANGSYTHSPALGRKASDEFAVPLCRSHHRAVHRSSNERVWWQATDIDPVKVARKLWKETVSMSGSACVAIVHPLREAVSSVGASSC